jgi:hypothetical protein
VDKAKNPVEGGGGREAEARSEEISWQEVAVEDTSVSCADDCGPFGCGSTVRYSLQNQCVLCRVVCMYHLLRCTTLMHCKTRHVVACLVLLNFFAVLEMVELFWG